MKKFAYRPNRQAYKDYNGLGSFGDDIEGMHKAINYLQNPPFKNSNAR